MMKKFTLFFFAVAFLFSCGQSEKEKQAQAKIAEIQNFVENGKYNAAKILIDSLHKNFPDLIKIRREAMTWEDTILLHQSEQMIAFCDSLLPQKQRETDSLKNFFRFEKDEKYQSTGSYISRKMNAANEVRTFLKVSIDEGANVYLTSTYGGFILEHESVMVSFNDLFAETAKIKHVHSFVTDDLHWETTTFTNQECENVLAFLAQYADKQIKVTLLGNKTFSYFLTPPDRKAIAETYIFWTVVRDKKMLNEQKRKAERKIELIKNRGKE